MVVSVAVVTVVTVALVLVSVTFVVVVAVVDRHTLSRIESEHREEVASQPGAQYSSIAVKFCAPPRVFQYAGHPPCVIKRRAQASQLTVGVVVEVSVAVVSVAVVTVVLVTVVEVAVTPLVVTHTAS